MKLSSYYKKLANRAVRCTLCRHRCIIREGESGICRIRVNKEGKLYSLVYGYPIALHIDPIEKKPLFHFLPGSNALSIATVGCNFRCKFCQNWDISQLPRDYNRVEGYKVSPEEVVGAALRSGSTIISYTYTEPTIFFEYALEIAGLAHAKGLRNIFVTNGYMTPEAIEMATGLIDAANVDLKAFSDKFYKKYCSARLAPVLETLKHMRSAGIWIEVTTLLIPGLNDDKHEIASLAEFIADSLGRETPWHISRFHPAYRLLDAPLTPVKSLTTAFEIGKDAGLKYVYIGNVATKHGADTFCSNCGTTVIDRKGYTARCNMTRDERCPVCNEKIQGVELSF